MEKDSELKSRLRIFIRRKGLSNKDIILVSDNQEQTKAGYLKYEAFSVPLDKIKKAFIVKGKIERNTL